MINDLRLKISYLLIGLLGYLFIAQTAAAAPLSLSIDPSIIAIKAIPPTNVTSSLNIQNKGDTQVALQIQLKPFNAKGENGEFEYSRETLRILKNIQILDANVSIESITLGPKQQRNLNLNINLPQDTNISARPPANSLAGEVGPARQSNLPDSASRGKAGAQTFAGGRDYYFSVVFVSTNSSSIESNSSVNQIGIATNVLLSVGSLETPKAVLEEFSSRIFFEKGPVPFTIRVKNTGAHFIKPTGGITIKNMFGQNIGKLDLLTINVLSDSIRAIPNSIYMQENSPDFKRPIALWKESFLLGLYTATLNISMSDEGPNFTKSIRFFAFPFQGLIVIAIVLISATIIIKRVRSYMER